MKIATSQPNERLSSIKYYLLLVPVVAGKQSYQVVVVEWKISGGGSKLARFLAWLNEGLKIYALLFEKALKEVVIVVVEERIAELAI